MLTRRSLGIMEAKGTIIATSDNHIFWSRNYLENMLPCFEDVKVRITDIRPGATYAEESELSG